MKTQIKKLLRESLLNEDKQKRPEELVDMLQDLPVDETAKYLTKEILKDLNRYYVEKEGYLPRHIDYVYTPKDKCLKPYELEVNFGPVNNPRIGTSSQHSITINYLHGQLAKDDYKVGWHLGYKIYNIIKHECSHFYMELKGVEECLYNTHPDGRKKYYVDRQELVLHGREIFEVFTKRKKNWQKMSLEAIQKEIKYRVSHLRDDKQVPGLFNGGVQLKYVLFIMKNYVIPNYNNPKFARPKKDKEVHIEGLASVLANLDNMNDREVWKNESDFKNALSKPEKFNTGNRNSNSTISKMEINNDKLGQIDISLITHNGWDPSHVGDKYVLKVAKDSKGSLYTFKTIPKIIKFLKKYELSDYLKTGKVTKN